MAKARRRRSPARLPWQETAVLRQGYLELYDSEHEQDVPHLLEALARMPRGLEADTLAMVARQSRLDRLKARDDSPSGVDLLWQWLELRRRAGPIQLWEVGYGGAVPEIDTAIRVTVEGSWQPSEKSRTSARKDLLGIAAALIDVELDRIDAAATQRGYLTPDSTHRRGEHLRWLFMRVRHRMSWTAIADERSLKHEDVVNPDTVRHAVERLAPLVGIELPDI